MIWTIDIGQLNTWYFLLIGITVFVSFVGMWIHKTLLPMVWGLIVSMILFFGAITIEPLIFGYQYYDVWSIPYILTVIFGIEFFILFAMYYFNILTKGTVVE